MTSTWIGTTNNPFDNANWSGNANEWDNDFVIGTTGETPYISDWQVSPISGRWGMNDGGYIVGESLTIQTGATVKGGKWSVSSFTNSGTIGESGKLSKVGIRFSTGTNSGTIHSGNYTGNLTNSGTITGGVFVGNITNSGTIAKGVTIHGTVTNVDGGTCNAPATGGYETDNGSSDKATVSAHITVEALATLKWYCTSARSVTDDLVVGITNQTQADESGNIEIELLRDANYIFRLGNDRYQNYYIPLDSDDPLTLAPIPPAPAPTQQY
jgi:hypothetical protein